MFRNGIRIIGPFCPLFSYPKWVFRAFYNVEDTFVVSARQWPLFYAKKFNASYVSCLLLHYDSLTLLTLTYYRYIYHLEINNPYTCNSHSSIIIPLLTVLISQFIRRAVCLKSNLGMSMRYKYEIQARQMAMLQIA